MLNRYIVQIVVLLLLQGCTPEGVSFSQEELHRKVHQIYQQAFDDFEAEIEASAKLIESSLNAKKSKSPHLAPGQATDQLSSFYIPDFSSRGLALNRFRDLSMSLEKSWDHFLKNHPYISWLYIFDRVSGALRIAPATPTELTFGTSMDFKKFEFFEAALREYPRVAWQKKTKEDMSGTGLILMASRALKNAKGNFSHVISGDVKVSYMSKSVQPLFDEFIAKTRSKGFHFFAYLKPTHHPRSTISEYASDQGEWLLLKAFSSSDSELLHVNPMTQAKLLLIEEGATRLAQLQEKSLTQNYVTGRVHLGNALYRCSASQLRNPQVLLWICSR